MTRKHVLWLLAALVGIYLWVVARRIDSVLFEERPGYLYHPATDQIFSITLEASVLDRAGLLNPFDEVRFARIDDAEPLGRLRHVIAERAADQRLLRENMDAWRKKNQRELEQRLAHVAAGQPLTFFDIFFRPRQDLSAARLLPAEFTLLEPYTHGDSAIVYAGDAVLLTWTSESPMKIDSLPNAIVIQGPPATWKLHELVGMP